VAERRPPGFNVDLGFYDSEEVLSIPRKIRAAAVGVWTLCGSYAANKLSDGYVPAEALRDRGCTPAIRAALMATEPEPLWSEASGGGIQFTRWAKWQRTSEEIKAYREAEAERKREARAKRKQGHVSDTRASRGDHVSDTWSSDEPHVVGDIVDTSSGRRATGNSTSRQNGETSGRTSAGHPGAVRPEDRDPKTETETETKRSVSYVGTEPTDARTQGISATPGASLVREIVPKGHPPATLTSLRLQASELLNTGTDESTVRIALQLWCDKPGVGIGRTILASLCSEAIKSRTLPSGNVHQITAFDRKKAANAAVFQALATEPTHLEIEP
jgi:hypothetical protein